MTTVDQRMESLRIANERRFEMLEIKRELRSLPFMSARYEAARLLREGNETLDSMKLRHFLTALPKVGTTKSSVVLRQIGVRNGDMRVRDLTDRQRGLLVEVLVGRTVGRGIPS